MAVPLFRVQVCRAEPRQTRGRAGPFRTVPWRFPELRVGGHPGPGQSFLGDFGNRIRQDKINPSGAGVPPGGDRVLIHLPSTAFLDELLRLLLNRLRLRLVEDA